MGEKICYGPKLSEETIKNANQSMSQYFIGIAEQYREKPLLVDASNEKCVTFGDMLTNSYRISNYLKRLGCEPDSVVAIVCENRFEYPSVFLGILHIKCIATCVSALYTTGEIIHAFNIAKPKVVFCSNVTNERVENVQNSLEFVKHVINLDNPEFLDDLNGMNCFLNKPYYKKSKPDDTAVILYSSGTTGLSKGVQLMHKNYIYLMEFYRTEKFVPFPKENNVGGLLPMCHAYGLFSLLLCITLGHTYYLIKRYVSELYLQYIEKYKMNTLFVIPGIMVFLSKDPLVEKYDLSSVKVISSGAGAIKKNVLLSLKERFNDCAILQNYGMTENTTMCLSSTPTSKLGPTGRLLPGAVAKIISTDDGNSLGAYQEGELCIKTPTLMKSYCDNQAKLIENFGPGDWFHSGDIAYFDDDEDFYVVDRIKDIIKYNGFQVPPSELENLLLLHPCVEGAAVVGVPDDEVGELPRAYIVLRAQSTITEQQIQKYVSDNISPQKRLRGGVKFVSELPRNLSGKILRKELKKWATSGI